jgi:alkylated DNA repair dioxygenase AlkB
MTAPYAGFADHLLDDGHHFFVGRLPEPLRPDATGFEALCALHPDDFHGINMPGGPVPTPRWQHAFGRDYHYTGRTNQALPVPPRLEPLLAWARRAIDDRLNGLLLNWYDGELGHSIGPHHYSITDMVPGAPIVTVSLGEERVFRLSHPQRKLIADFVARDGTLIVMPFDSNRAWKHGVPKLARY